MKNVEVVINPTEIRSVKYSNAFSPWYSQPNIVENAKSAMPSVIKNAPVLPSTVSKALIVSAEPTSSSLY